MPNMGRGTDSGATDMKEMIYIFSRNYKKEMNNIHCLYISVTVILTLCNESSSSDLCSNLLDKIKVLSSIIIIYLLNNCDINVCMLF